MTLLGQDLPDSRQSEVHAKGLYETETDRRDL